MKLADLSAVQLQSLIRLVKEKEALAARLGQIEQRIQEIEDGVAPLHKPRKIRRWSRRDGRKATILRALEAAGVKGLNLRQIAEEVGISYASVRVWFSTTGKGLDKIEKLAPATYRFVPTES